MSFLDWEGESVLSRPRLGCGWGLRKKAPRGSELPPGPPDRAHTAVGRPGALLSSHPNGAQRASCVPTRVCEPGLLKRCPLTRKKKPVAEFSVSSFQFS